MIRSANSHSISEIFNVDIPVFYEVPKYQREFVWGRDQWEAILNDLQENDPGHFLGSIICICHSGDAVVPNRLEVVDGQQRLTTIALMYAAIFERMGRIGKDDGELAHQRWMLQRRLLADGKPRIILSLENRNNEDFEFILDEVGLLKVAHKPPHVGNRRLYKAFDYFRKRIQDFGSVELLDLIQKINRALVVKIEVDTHADAFALFESLNNRGLPLSAIDLIKNKILATLEKTGKISIDHAFVQWTQMVEHLPDYTIQERFLRHFYNAFQHEPRVKVNGVRIVRRSNLIRVYEKLIDRDPEWIFNELMEKSELYAHYIDESEDNEQSFLDLQRVGGAPGYLLLLYLDAKYGHECELTEKVAGFLVKYFVRRNLTDYPPTRDLDNIFIDLIEHCERQGGTITEETIASYLTEPRRYASDQEFREKLESDIYLVNAPLARFLLCKIEENHATKDFKPALWDKDQFGHYRMTIEHILPEGPNLPEAWVKMIAAGDRKLAYDLQQQWCHKLGNLTLTAYNPHLSNYPFEKKRDRVDAKGLPVGYRNGLYLNRDLAQKTEWTIEDIRRRTDSLIKEILDLYG